MIKKLRFPEGFLWGSSVSSYQVEGDINNSDWSINFPAGKACQYYEKFEKYFDIAKELNQNVHRFSLEWSRIQPEEGKFDRDEIEHYKKVLLSLKKRGIKSMLTVWHWTLPIWLAKIGGWKNHKSNMYFHRYVELIAHEFKDLVDYWIVLNEPEIYISLGYFLGKCPPQKKLDSQSLLVYENLINAHSVGYDTIHKTIPAAQVSSALNISYVDSFKDHVALNYASSKIWDWLRNGLFVGRLKNKMDFLAVNYYFHDRIKLSLIKFPYIFSIKNENKEVSDLGWEIYPEGVFHILEKLKKYNLPIFITENGIADKNDTIRARYITDHLIWIHKAISHKADVRGYLYWSLIDNFEWTFGFGPRFGLVEMNYTDMETKIRPSAYIYSKICKENSVEIH